MKKVLIISLLFVLTGCSNKISKDALKNLNGYWQIETVVLADGNKKEYNLSTTVDYIKIDDLKGYRKKVQPKFDGTYETSNDAEPFTIVEKEGFFEMNYKNDLSSWKENITAIEENNFSVVNEENITYNYKRFEPFSLK